MPETQNALTVLSDVKFGFRQNKETGEKRPDVEVKILLVTAAGIIAALNSGDEKQVSMIEDVVNGLITSQLRTYVDADPEFDQAKADALSAEGKLTIEAIANLPRAERNTVSKDDLEQFAKAYVELMPGITGKDLEKVQTAAGLFVERFKRASGDDKVLQVLQQQLNIFVEKAPEDVVAANEKAITYAANKLSELLSLKVTADAL